MKVGENLTGIDDNTRKRGVERNTFPVPLRWRKVDSDGAEITLLQTAGNGRQFNGRYRAAATKLSDWITFLFPSHYLPSRTVVLAIVFHCLGDSKNVYDDDDDKSRAERTPTRYCRSATWPSRLSYDCCDVLSAVRRIAKCEMCAVATVQRVRRRLQMSRLTRLDSTRPDIVSNAACCKAGTTMQCSEFRAIHNIRHSFVDQGMFNYKMRSASKNNFSFRIGGGRYRCTVCMNSYSISDT